MTVVHLKWLIKAHPNIHRSYDTWWYFTYIFLTLIVHNFRITCTVSASAVHPIGCYIIKSLLLEVNSTMINLIAKFDKILNLRQMLQYQSNLIKIQLELIENLLSLSDVSTIILLFTEPIVGFLSCVWMLVTVRNQLIKTFSFQFLLIYLWKQKWTGLIHSCIFSKFFFGP